MEAIMYYLICALASVVVITVMGFSKAYTSYALGDIYVRNSGKVTLNPKAHFEIIGFILFIFFGYGWVAPIETSSLHYKDRKKSNILVCIVPFIVALILAFVSVLFYSFTSKILVHNTMLKYIPQFFNTLAVLFINFFVFNLIPIYPLYGQKLFQTLLPMDKALSFSRYEKVIQIIIIMLLLSGLLQGLLNSISQVILNLLIFPIRSL